ncbi:MAG TPA: hypothetical protein PKM50_09275 [Methanoregula sp.]|nr:hypothetical protein [Methanoregula sp.]
MYGLVDVVGAVIIIVVGCGIILMIVDHRIVVVHPGGPDPDPWIIALTPIGVYIATLLSFTSLFPAGDNLVASCFNVIASAVVTAVLSVMIARTISMPKTVAK